MLREISQYRWTNTAYMNEESKIIKFIEAKSREKSIPGRGNKFDNVMEQKHLSDEKRARSCKDL